MEEVPLNWVVAWRLEAEPIIEHYRMKRIQSVGFEHYETSCGSDRLIISGMGKVKAAAATGWLAAQGKENGARRAWLNFGIAGSGKEQIGETFLASAVRDSARKESWYPAMIWKRNEGLPRREVLTVDSPTSEYPVDSLVEMEASGFYAAALSFATVERCQVIKVISDNEREGWGNLEKERMREICRTGFEKTLPWVKRFRSILEEVSPPSDWQELLEAWEKRTDLTKSLEVKLRRLLEQGIALDLSVRELEPSGAGSRFDRRETKQLLAELEERLKEVRRKRNT